MLLRALQGKIFTRYPIFYFYLSYVLLESLLRFYVYLSHPGFYSRFYWGTQFVSVAVGYAVIWEIYRQALRRYPGTARMAKGVLLTVFALVVSKVFVNSLTGPVWSPAKSTAELERNLRTVQGILLLAVVALLAYYAIPVGRNLKGMIVGYGFFIGTSLIHLTLRSHLGDAFQVWWQYLQPAAYALSLLIWCAALWSYQPNPQPQRAAGIEEDYELLAAETRRMLAQVRAYLARGVRP